MENSIPTIDRILGYLGNLEIDCEARLDDADMQLGKTIRETLDNMIITKDIFEVTDFIPCLDRLLGCESSYAELELVKEIIADVSKLCTNEEK